jgi:hypothetical protein
MWSIYQSAGPRKALRKRLVPLPRSGKTTCPVRMLKERIDKRGNDRTLGEKYQAPEKHQYKNNR